MPYLLSEHCADNLSYSFDLSRAPRSSETT